MDASTSTLDRIFASGQEKPATNPNHFRLYNHNLCPFSTRTRYHFAAKGIAFQDCQMDLNDKKPWHVAFNQGSVPFLETPQGDLIPESAVLAQFAIESNPNGGVALIPSDPFEAAKMRVKIEQFNKLLPNLFGVLLSRG